MLTSPVLQLCWLAISKPIIKLNSFNSRIPSLCQTSLRNYALVLGFFFWAGLYYWSVLLLHMCFEEIDMGCCFFPLTLQCLFTNMFIIYKYLLSHIHIILPCFGKTWREKKLLLLNSNRPGRDHLQCSCCSTEHSPDMWVKLAVRLTKMPLKLFGELI